MKTSFFIAQKFLRPEGGSNFLSFNILLSIGGVTIGVATLVAVLSIFNGYQSNLETILLSMTPHIQIKKHLQKQKEKPKNDLSDFDDPFIDDWLQEEENLEEKNQKKCEHEQEKSSTLGDSNFTPSEHEMISKKLAGIKSIALLQPVIMDTRFIQVGEMSGVKKSVELTIYGNNFEGGFSSTYLPRLFKKGQDSVQGIGRLNQRNIILSEGITERKDTAPFPVTLGLLEGDLLVSEIQFQNIDFFSLGLRGQEENVVVMSLQSAQKILDLDGYSNLMSVQLHDSDQAKEIARKVRQKLGANYLVIDWISLSQKIFSLLKLLKTITFTVLFLIILVSSFSIRTTLNMLVLQKKKQIAVLKAMGNDRRGIYFIFLQLSLFIGGVGSILGIALGISIAYLVQFFQSDWLSQLIGIQEVSIAIEPFDLFLVLISVLMVCYLSALFPAHRASKLDPILGLQAE